MKFSDCKTAADLLAFFDNDSRALNHKYFYHYTSFTVAESVFKGNAFWMSQLCETSNDAYEKQWYQSKGKYLFSLCFSTGSVESIPLWYLYARKGGSGARLIIPKTLMNTLWKYATYTLVEIVEKLSFGDVIITVVVEARSSVTCCRVVHKKHTFKNKKTPHENVVLLFVYIIML